MLIKKEIVFSIPIYNEEKSIENVLREIRKYSEDDIVIINDGSLDSSQSVIDAVAKELPGNINIINHKNNMGYGQSLIDGFNYSIENNYQFVITMDSDGQHEP